MFLVNSALTSHSGRKMPIMPERVTFQLYIIGKVTLYFGNYLWRDFTDIPGNHMLPKAIPPVP